MALSNLANYAMLIRFRLNKYLAQFKVTHLSQIFTQNLYLTDICVFRSINALIAQAACNHEIRKSTTNRESYPLESL